MDKIPAEIWDMIFGYLLNSKDIENASTANPIWRTLLYPSRSSWLFGQTIPLLLEDLSKEDLLHCRLVCRHWRYAVDYYLENNPYHRPDAEDDWPSINRKIDFRPKILDSIFRSKILNYYCHYNEENSKMNMLKDALNHPCCPIVGRSVLICDRPRPEVESLNTSFLQTFGRHIYFVCIAVEGRSALGITTRVLKFLKLLPNLKRLNLVSFFQIHSTENKDNFHEYMKTLKTEEQKENLPKIETLQIPKCDNEITHVLLNLLSNENLTSLEMFLERPFPKLECQYITNLRITLEKEHDLLHLLKVDWRLQKLAVDIRERFPIFTVFHTIRHFKATLRDLEITLAAKYLSYGVFSRGELEPFSDQEMFSGFPNLKRLSLEGFHPLCLNFLVPLKDTLEYLSRSYTSFRRT